MEQAPRPDSAHRFTLLELTLVVIVLALAVGALTRSRDLVFETEVRSTYNLGRTLSAAVYAYRDQRDFLPGDDPWASPGGNGNGLVDGAIGCRSSLAASAPVAETNLTGSTEPTPPGEACLALVHLRQAGLLKGRADEPMSVAAGVEAVLVRADPAGPVGQIGPAGPVGTGAPSASGLVAGLRGPGLTHRLMRAIDERFDDGQPGSGHVRCSGLGAYASEASTAMTPIEGGCSLAL